MLKKFVVTSVAMVYNQVGLLLKELHEVSKLPYPGALKVLDSVHSKVADSVTEFGQEHLSDEERVVKKMISAIKTQAPELYKIIESSNTSSAGVVLSTVMSLDEVDILLSQEDYEDLGNPGVGMILTLSLKPCRPSRSKGNTEVVK